jgi:hypothetical protein
VVQVRLNRSFYCGEEVSQVLNEPWRHHGVGITAAYSNMDSRTQHHAESGVKVVVKTLSVVWNAEVWVCLK